MLRSTGSSSKVGQRWELADRRNKAFSEFFWAAFVAQIAGRLLDLQWHRTHPEFETAQDQVTAHWLVWLGTPARDRRRGSRLATSETVGIERVGYRVTLWSNLLYLLLALAHFVQHLSRQEVDWTHIALAVANVAAAAGVLTLTAGRLKQPAEQEMTRGEPSR